MITSSLSNQPDYLALLRPFLFSFSHFPLAQVMVTSRTRVSQFLSYYSQHQSAGTAKSHSRHRGSSIFSRDSARSFQRSASLSSASSRSGKRGSVIPSELAIKTTRTNSNESSTSPNALSSKVVLSSTFSNSSIGQKTGKAQTAVHAIVTFVKSGVSRLSSTTSSSDDSSTRSPYSKHNPSPTFVQEFKDDVFNFRSPSLIMYQGEMKAVNSEAQISLQMREMMNASHISNDTRRETLSFTHYYGASSRPSSVSSFLPCTSTDGEEGTELTPLPPITSATHLPADKRSSMSPCDHHCCWNEPSGVPARSQQDSKKASSMSHEKPGRSVDEHCRHCRNRTVCEQLRTEAARRRASTHSDSDSWESSVPNSCSPLAPVSNNAVNPQLLPLRSSKKVTSCHSDPAFPNQVELPTHAKMTDWEDIAQSSGIRKPTARRRSQSFHSSSQVNNAGCDCANQAQERKKPKVRLSKLNSSPSSSSNASQQAPDRRQSDSLPLSFNEESYLKKICEKSWPSESPRFDIDLMSSSPSADALYEPDVLVDRRGSKRCRSASPRLSGTPSSECI